MMAAAPGWRPGLLALLSSRTRSTSGVSEDRGPSDKFPHCLNAKWKRSTCGPIDRHVHDSEVISASGVMGPKRLYHDGWRQAPCMTAFVLCVAATLASCGYDSGMREGFYCTYIMA